MGETWHCLVVVVVSDDPAFLAAFAHLSLRRQALRWSTRILVLTRLPLNHLGGLHGLLSNRNAMLLHVQKGKEDVSKVNVLVWQPYSAPASRPLRVATWTPHGRLTLASHVSLFPDKFSVFTTPPTLTVAVEFLPYHTLTWVDDPQEPGGRRLLLTGFLNNFVTYFAKAMNFKYVLSPERTFGTKLPNGSWTGMMGMVVREVSRWSLFAAYQELSICLNRKYLLALVNAQTISTTEHKHTLIVHSTPSLFTCVFTLQEADFSPAPFALNPARNEAVDPSAVYGIVEVRILSGLTGLKIDPWGFLLPLTPLVWAVTLAALLGVLFVLHLFPTCLPCRSLLRGGWSANTFSPVRVLLQQGEASGTVLDPSCWVLPCVLMVSVLSGSSSRAIMKTNSASLTPNADVVWPAEWWWWERLVLGLWMLMTLVLTKSYAGNLVSLLAVRYVPQPFQTLQDIVDNDRVAVIAQKHSTFEQSLREVKFGVFREVAKLEDKGRLSFLTQSQLLESLDSLVRAGHHVLVDLDVNHRRRLSLDFSRNGTTL
ncbi:uncharacterized protein LOC135113487 [Scylla paramamosain]|uniref:uncharacterized protein LOC135113487 n=1 Tax=Scylla paramamosain TaxID=85552 RepID=UPI003083D332